MSTPLGYTPFDTNTQKPTKWKFSVRINNNYSRLPYIILSMCFKSSSFVIGFRIKQLAGREENISEYDP